MLQSLLQTYVHIIHELVVLTEGEIEIEIEGKSVNSLIGEEVFINANSMNIVGNIGNKHNVLYCGDKKFYNK